MAVPKKPGETVRRARADRRRLSPAEIRLWAALRRDPGGLHFRRQHPAGRYRIDFYSAGAKLAVEVDGQHHDRGDRPDRDAARDAWLAGFGIATLRINASEVYRDLDAVVRGIVAAARDRLPLHHPAARRGPPPQAVLGEE